MNQDGLSLDSPHDGDVLWIFRGNLPVVWTNTKISHDSRFFDFFVGRSQLSAIGLHQSEADPCSAGSHGQLLRAAPGRWEGHVG